MKIQNLTLSVITSVILINTQTLANQSDEETLLDPIVVSSDFRDKKLSQTSNTVTVISYSNLEDKATLPIEEVIGEVPNINFSTGASKAHYIQIRGIGERSQFKAPINPSVGLITDGIDVSNSALPLSLYDVEQVEILKGPQGTTFGSNGMAGVVSLQSVEPSEATTGNIEATFGNYNTKALGMAVGGSLIEDKLLGRISAYKNTSDGFMKNKYLNRDDTQNIDELNIKTQLKYFASENHTIDLNFLHSDVDNGYDAFTFDNSYNSYADQPGTDAQKTDAIALKSTYQLNDKAHLISKASFSKSKSIYSYDEDWTYEGYHEDGYSSFDEYKRKRYKKDIDLRLVSDEQGKIFGNSTNWTVGVYYKDQSEDLTRNYTYLDSPYKSSFDTRNLATYGQLDSALNDKLTLSTGLRVEKWKADFNDSDNLNINTDETLVGGKVGLSYQKDKNDLYYITLSKGYKPGGVNADNSLSSYAREFKTEHLYNLDIGKNFSSFENKLKTRLNFFYGLRRDQQVKSSVVQIRDDGSTDYTDYLANAARSHYYGLELQSDYYASDDLHLFASLGLLKSKFDKYDDPNPNNVDVNGREPAQSPKYQYNVGFDYMLTQNLQFKTDVEGKGSYYFSNRHNEKAKAYALLNASLTYISDDDWSLNLWGRNLTDKRYETRGFGSFGNNPANGYTIERYTQLGSPRTFGVTFRYDF